ncbi:ParB/RepB/Spo0J family partition protein [Coxiella burnetii]|uniref:ParB/RepB/Spo0J family partition protein n=1 Tax=Coxiella burnetii TaxID=777 RepID=UPI000CCC2906|nr:ParB/RepB/Spo0J family partition protein [Coxiella burnetii]PNT87809.1 chromosome partitioning protein ParB [Coxiella burnetii]
MEETFAVRDNVNVLKGKIMADIELKGLKGLRDLKSLANASKTNDLVAQNLYFLSIDLLQTGKYQPRKGWIKESLQELVNSIKSQGIIQPLIVRQIQTNRYEIIAGERRWRAAKEAGLKKVPAIIRNVDDTTALAFALIENIQRENLNPIDEALAFSRLRDEFSMSHAAISETVGRSRTAVTNILRLLSLDDSVKVLLQTDKLEMGHARALLTLPKDQQILFAQKIIDKNLTVREAEKLVQFAKTPKETKPAPYADEVQGWVNQLSRSLSSKIAININEKGEGKVIIHFTSPEEVDWLVEHFTDKAEE